jgi:hypothetical protein
MCVLNQMGSTQSSQSTHNPLLTSALTGYPAGYPWSEPWFGPLQRELNLPYEYLTRTINRSTLLRTTFKVGTCIKMDAHVDHASPDATGADFHSLRYYDEPALSTSSFEDKLHDVRYKLRETVTVQQCECIQQQQRQRQQQRCTVCNNTTRLPCSKCKGRQIVIRRSTVQCPDCIGHGHSVCRECKGYGYTELKCTICRGRGYKTCDKCRGSGYAMIATAAAGTTSVSASSKYCECGGGTVECSCVDQREGCYVCAESGYLTCSTCNGSCNVPGPNTRIKCDRCEDGTIPCQCAKVPACSICEGHGHLYTCKTVIVHYNIHKTVTNYFSHPDVTELLLTSIFRRRKITLMYEDPFAPATSVATVANAANVFSVYGVCAENYEDISIQSTSDDVLFRFIFNPESKRVIVIANNENTRCCF